MANVTQELFNAVNTIAKQEGLEVILHRPTQYRAEKPIGYISNISWYGEATKDIGATGELVISFILWSNGDDVIKFADYQMNLVAAFQQTIMTSHYVYTPTNSLNMMVTEITEQEQNIRNGTINFHWKYSTR